MHIIPFAEFFEKLIDCRIISNAHKRLLSLRVLHLILTVFVKGEDPPQDLGISDTLEIPIRMIFEQTRPCRQISVGILPIRDAMRPVVSC